MPKQFCRFGGSRSLLQETMRRLAPLVPPEDTVVVVDATQVGWAEAQLGGLEGLEILAQPCDRGTAPGVLFPLSHVLERDGDSIVLVAPSDHGFADERAFQAGILRAKRAVEEGVAEIVVFGAKATAPNSDYGWMVRGAPLNGELFRLTRFVEKPDPALARHMFADGGLWNTMIVVAEGRALLDRYRHALPVWAEVFRTARELPPAQRLPFLDLSYQRVPPADFSRDILGGAAGLAVYPWPDALGWTDLGTPERLLAWLDENGRLRSRTMRDRRGVDVEQVMETEERGRRLWTST